MKLSVSDLFKKYTKGPYTGKARIIRFAEKYKSGDPFELNTGEKVVLSFNQEIYSTLINAEKYPTKYQKELQKAQFATAKGQKYYKVTDFKKTIEFDGKPDRPPAGIEAEIKTVERINIQLTNIIKKYNYKKGVPIKTKGGIVYAVKCDKVPGTPKSDLALFDVKGKEVLWISYKKGKTAKDFQQWGGISDPIMQAFPQVRDFISKMKSKFPSGMKSGDSVGMKIMGKNSSLLKAKAVYGVDYKPGAPLGRNNVSYVVQGRLIFADRGSYYEIVSSNAHAYQNGDKLRSSEDPIFYARYTGERGQFGVEKSRMVIYPYSGAKPKEWLS